MNPFLSSSEQRSPSLHSVTSRGQALSDFWLIFASVDSTADCKDFWKSTSNLPPPDICSSEGVWCCCSVTKSYPTLYNPVDCSTPGSSVLDSPLEFAPIHIYWVSDAIQPSHPLLPTSPVAFNLCQHQGLFQWVRSSHQVGKVLELQLQSFQWIFRVDFL